MAGSTPSFWKTGDGQRGYRRPSHRPNVVDRIERGDAAIVVRVVHDRRKEVHSLDQRQIVAQTIDPSIVGGVKAYQDVFVNRLHGQAAKRLGQHLCRELGRTTRTRNHFRQTHQFSLISLRF
jgi:hypothetical protein